MNERIEFFKNVENQIKSGKKIVLVSGASSSGKSYVSKKLCDYLNEKGISTFYFSADNYYKGISRTIVQKALLNNDYNNEVKKHFKNICQIVKNITQNSPFPEKMCKNNVNLINKELNKLFSADISNKLTKDIKTEFERINFDEPFAVDLKLLANNINMLVDNQNIIIPDYSFKTGEVEFYKENLVNAKNYDVFIIEGIYALREEVVNNIDRNNFVSCAIECDLKTLISRKLDRDIVKQRSSLTSEQVIISYLTQAMPSYFRYIAPSLKNADLKLSTSLTQDEINERKNIKQTKYLAIENLDKYLISLGASLISYQNQTDYFLEDKFYKSKNDVVLRLREVDGLATNLTLKTNYDIQKNNKKVEEYNLVDGFSEQNRKIDSMLTNFINCGFYVSTIVHKTRKEFMLNGQKIKLDYLNNNCYVELDNIELSKQQELEKLLFLGEQINESYYQINMQDLETCEHNECELKLKINSKIDDLSLKTFKKSTIFQTYLNLEDKNTLEFIYSFVPQNLDISAFSEARIRTVNNKSFLTLKSKGDLIRKEYEKEIPFCLTKKLKELPTNGRIEKVRYDIINLDDVVVTLDKYLNKNLNVIEAEFDDKKYSYDYVINLIQNQFPKFKFEDVTYNINYKNSNLAK